MSKKQDTSTTVTETPRDLEGRVAVVTGASRGIGKAIATELARRGVSIGLCARFQPQLSQAESEIKQLGVKCIASTVDVRDESAVASFALEVQQQFGTIDILVNNAGIYKTEPVESQSLETWREILDTNLTGAMLFCRAVVKIMTKQKWGRIINISSVSGRVGEIWGSAYSSSKFGMIGLTQSLALEVAQHGITVNAVCPGWVLTKMTREQLSDPKWCLLNETDPAESLANTCFGVPQNRFIEPEEVASLVAYLSSESARGITGQSINICGGLSLQ